MAELTTATAIADVDVVDTVVIPVRKGAVVGLLKMTLLQLKNYIGFTAESVRDTIGACLVAGTGVTITVNDGADTITIAASGSAPTETLVIAAGDETTAITTGVAKVTFRMPYAFTVTAVRASLTTASSSGNPQVDINEAGVSILSTKLTIDATEKTSTTAATPAVISDASLADDAEITIDIDTSGTGAAGLKVYLIGHQ